MPYIVEYAPPLSNMALKNPINYEFKMLSEPYWLWNYLQFEYFGKLYVCQLHVLL